MRTFLPISILLLILAKPVNGQTTNTAVIRVVWGNDLTMRLDTLTGQTSDSIRYNRSTFRIRTDSSYSWNYYPAECKGILVFTDADSKVQNFAVKSYQYEYFNGNIMRGGTSNHRDLWTAAMSIEKHKAGDYVTISKVQLTDLAGKPMHVIVPPFRLVKTR